MLVNTKDYSGFNRQQSASRMISPFQVKPSLLYGNQSIYEKIYHRLVILYQEKTGMERLLIDWSNSTVREGNSTPESKRKIGAIPQTIAKNTVCKKFKVSISDRIECPLLGVLIDFYRIK